VREMDEDELVRQIKGVHALGIRSKTQVTQRVLDAADKLLTIGAFCIGTDQTDLDAAAQHGVCVFNVYTHSLPMTSFLI
jgi:D-3-phosphoglycerate dehydrogenase